MAAIYHLGPRAGATEDFLSTLSPEFKNVIEFRHESWYDESVWERLRAHRVTFCTVSSGQVPATPVETSRVAYFRFHGLTGGHRYNYTDEEFARWAETIRGSRAEECYVYFNND